MKTLLPKLGFVSLLLLSGFFPLHFASAAVACSFPRNLKLGDRGADVQRLQIILNENPATQVATAGNGSPQHETTFYGLATKTAVIHYQQLHTQSVLLPYGLAHGTGILGTLTRRYLVTTQCQNAAVSFNTTAPTMTPLPAQPETTPTNTITNPVTAFTTPAFQSSGTGLAALAAQLHPNDSTDDTATIQEMIDVANQNKISTITLPAGTFKLASGLHLYGSNITFSGQGDQTVLDFFDSYHGGDYQGMPITVGATVNQSATYNPVQSVTGNTIVFGQSVPFRTGDTLFLSDGMSATRVLERQYGGTLDVPNEFNAPAPSEFVTVASVTTNAQGQTVVTLINNVIGSGDYANLLPSGQAANNNYLTVWPVTAPADHITIKNLAIHFSNPQADVSIMTLFSTNFTIDHVHILNTTQAGGHGGFSLILTTNYQLTNDTVPGGIAINSSRQGTISGNTIGNLTFEESSTHTTAQNNVIGTPGGSSGIAVRTGDMGCNQISILNNIIYAGPTNVGGIGIWEGRNITIANNTVSQGDALIWVGQAHNVVVRDNTAASFANNDVIDTASVNAYNNSWK